MSDWAPVVYDLRRTLREFSPGDWIAIEPKTAKVLANAATADAAMQTAAAVCPDPIVIRVPLNDPAEVYTVGQPPPHDAILRAWRGGRVVPFLGAGASVAEGLPSASRLTEELIAASKFPPGGIADRDLARVSSYYLATNAREDLRGWLRDRLGSGAAPKPGKLHELIATMTAGDSKLIMTTNYDRLIEEGLEQQHIPYDLLVYPTDTTNENQNAALWIPWGEAPQFRDPKREIPFDRPVVYKMHGSLAQNASLDSFVITEDDYMTFLERMIEQTAIPKAILEYLDSRRLLFLGYGLRDWNLRIVLQKLDRSEREMIGWAIQSHPSPAECEIWRLRKVKIYDELLDDFADKMK